MCAHIFMLFGRPLGGGTHPAGRQGMPLTIHRIGDGRGRGGPDGLAAHRGPPSKASGIIVEGEGGLVVRALGVSCLGHQRPQRQGLYPPSLRPRPLISLLQRDVGRTYGRFLSRRRVCATSRRRRTSAVIPAVAATAKAMSTNEKPVAPMLSPGGSTWNSRIAWATGPVL